MVDLPTFSGTLAGGGSVALATQNACNFANGRAGTYFADYPENIKLYGASFNTSARLQLALNASAEEQLMGQYLQLAPFPENRAVLQELQRRHIPTGILSNGDPTMLAAAVKSAGFDGLLQHQISVHTVRRFKTDPAAYALGPQTLGLAAANILFVSSNAWDALGATWFGYTTLWVNRAGAPPEQLEPPPTHTGSSLHDVLALFPPAP